MPLRPRPKRHPRPRLNNLFYQGFFDKAVLADGLAFLLSFTVRIDAAKTWRGVVIM
jgi:hypothetical protein